MIKIFATYLAMLAAFGIIASILLSVAPGCDMNSKSITIGDSMLQGGCPPAIRARQFP